MMKFEKHSLNVRKKIGMPAITASTEHFSVSSSKCKSIKFFGIIIGKKEMCHYLWKIWLSTQKIQ